MIYADNPQKISSAMATTFIFLPPQPILFFPSKFNFPIQNPNFHNHHHHHKPRFIPKIPFSSSSPFRNGSTPPKTECPVPFVQQPINEYQNLSNSFPFSRAFGDLVEYHSRLAVIGASFALFIGLPVAWFGTVGPNSEPLKRVLGAVSSGILVVTLAVLRMYLGWAYVGSRLLSATVEYEQTGWYDGQIWVKTAEVLTCDRLLGEARVEQIKIYTRESIRIFTPHLKKQEDNDRLSQMLNNYDESARSFEPDAFCGEPDLG